MDLSGRFTGDFEQKGLPHFAAVLFVQLYSYAGAIIPA